MFPDARKVLGEKRLVALGAELHLRKQELKENPPSEPFGSEQDAFTAAK